MRLFKPIVALVCSLFVVNSANACTDDRDPTESIVLLSSTLALCDEIIDSIDGLVDDLLHVTKLKKKETGSSYDYWSEWSVNNTDTPIITQQIEDSYLGVGVYRPYDMTLNDSELSYEEWIKTHGVQLSLGIGQKNKHDPRVRLDYQWHAQNEDVIHVQVEVPF